ncbi:hypothetical protein [Mesorhizobium sp. M0496]|uniref:hypothetical protein n=2 Tax=unclassified Mesorhizobium TaxID=325217 RepID=UPI003336474D
MPNLAEIYANEVDIAVLGGIAILASVGIYLVLRRIAIGVQRRRIKPDADLSEGIPYPPGEASWDWQCPVDPATGRASSSQVAALSDTADLNVRPQNANYRQFGVRVEHFDASSEACERSSVTTATASPSHVPRPIGLVLRLGVAAICLAVPLGYAMTRQNWIERAPAISQAQGSAHPEPSRSFELPASAALGMHRPAQGDGRTNVELLNPDLRVARAQVGAVRAQAAAARELARQEQGAAEGERARSAALQKALLASSKPIDALRATMAAADNAREERLRNELAAARTLDALRRIAGDARTLLRETANYVFVEMPAAHLERQRTEWLARELSRARAQIEQLEIETAKDRTKAKVSLAQASGMLDDERRKSADLRGDLAKVELSNAALVERADAAEQERTAAVKARQRAEQTAAETAQALARERAAAVSIHEDLDRTRRERDAARALVAGVAGLKTALDKQREAAASLARDLATARADNDRLRTERPSAQVEPSPRPRSARAAAATGQVKAVSQKTARSKVRNPSRTTRVRSITLPYSLRPIQTTLE